MPLENYLHTLLLIVKETSNIKMNVPLNVPTKTLTGIMGELLMQYIF